jgi:hypothetical protein
MLRGVFLGIPLVLLATACSYDNGDAQRVSYADPQCTTPSRSTVDTDRQLEVDAGQGAGVFIEYQTGGHWLLTTSCDTLRTNTTRTCQWDILLTPQDGDSLSNVVGSDLEADDSLLPFTDGTGSFQLLATTSGDLDSLSFDSGPGASVLVDALLDGSCALPYFFWIGDGGLHTGSPSNPLILTPSAE